MKFYVRAIILTLLIFLQGVMGSGEAAARSRRYKMAPVDCYADIVIEADTGYILRSRNRNARRYPASLTKMMTLYLVFQAIEKGQIDLDTRLYVSRLAAQQPATKIGLRVGQKIRVYDAIMSLVTESANDAAVVLAEGIGGDVRKFVFLMNKQAKALGMHGTIFQNPSGLPDRNQYTTAQDMAVLARSLIHHYPGFYPYFSQTSYDYAGRKMHNHNKLQNTYEGMDGIKTGYTNASGFNLAASAVRHDVRLIGVVMGGKTSKSRNKQMEKILDSAFENVRKPDVRALLARGVPRRENANYLFASTKAPVLVPAQKTQQIKLAMASPNVEIPAASSIIKRRAWGLQIGAFSELSGAEQMLEETARASRDLLDDAEQSLQKITMTDGSTIYRARFLGIDQKTARAVCTHLIKNGQNCLVVSGI